MNRIYMLLSSSKFVIVIFIFQVASLLTVAYLYFNQGNVGIISQLEKELIIVSLSILFLSSILFLIGYAYQRSRSFAMQTGVITDVLKQRDIELDLQKSEALHRAILAVSPDLITISDLNGKISFASPQALNMFGYDSLAEFTQLSIWEHLVSEDHERIQNNIEKMLGGELESAVEYVAIKQDGSRFYVDINSSVLPEIDGQPISFISVTRDISDRKKAEIEAAKSQEKYRSLVESSDAAIMMFDIEGVCLYINKIGAFPLGLIPEDMVGLGIDKFIPPEQSGSIISNIKHVIENNQGKVIEEKVDINGGNRWYRSSIQPVKNESGQAYAALVYSANITEFKLAEKKISDQNEKLIAIINSIPDKIFVHDAEGYFLEVYTSNPDGFIVPVDKLLGHNLIDLFGEEIGQLNIDKIQECISTRKLVYHEFTFHVKGQPMHFEVRVVPFMKNEVIRFVRDITEKKESEAEIRKLSRAVEQSPVLVVITDLKGNMEYVNPVFEKTTGYSLDEVIGKNRSILKSGKTNQATYKRLWDTITSGDEWQGELLNKKKNGELYWESISITPLYNDSGELTNYLAIIQDITERKRVEQEISELNSMLEHKVAERTEELENFFSVAIDLLCIANTSGDFLKVNKAWEDFLGYKKVDIEKRKFLDFVHPDDLSITLAALEQLSEQKPIFGMVNRFKTKEGNYRFIEWHSVPVGKIIYAAARDVTSYIDMENALREAQEKALSASQAKSIFLANMSHEIRTPMNAILGYAELLSLHIQDKIQKEFLDSIKTSGKTLLTLINDILDLSKVEAGKMELEFDYIETSIFFSEFQQIFAFKISEKDLTYNTYISPDCPPFLYLDGARLRQVLINLIGNAVKFTDRGSISLVVKIDNAQHDIDSDNKNEAALDLIIDIVDTGKGIPELFQDKLFESFAQAKGDEGAGGTGLGLPIAKQLISLMGGNISVKSAVGEGSIFTVFLPDIPYSANQTLNGNASSLNPKDVIFDKAIILVVDDVVHNRKFFKDVLRETEIEVIEAVNGIDALDVLETSTPNLIITDIRMPGMDGFGLLKKIKEIERLKDIPVFAYSASVMKEQKEKIRNSEFAELLIKPLQVTALYQALMSVLTHRIIASPKSAHVQVPDCALKDVFNYDGLMEKLEGDFMTVHHSFGSRQPLGEVRGFGIGLVALGVKHNCVYLENYGGEIIEAADSFNIEGILKLLRNFKGVILRLKKLKE